MKIPDSDHPITNSDVFLVTSTNGGASWSGPTQVDSSPTDQWFPWADINPTNGTIGVIYHDRRVADPTLYDTALKEFPGSKTFASTAPCPRRVTKTFLIPNCRAGSMS